MLPEVLLKDRFWLRFAILVLIVAWSMPVVALSLYAESHEILSVVFGLAWSAVVLGCGLLLYRAALKSAAMASLAIVLAFTTFVLLFRDPFSFVEPQFKVEDASVFYTQQRELGIDSFFIAYHGYYHTLVRIFAALISPVPTLFVPAFYNLAWLGIYSAVTTYILFQYPDKKWAPLIACVPALIAHSGEVFMSITYAPVIGGLFLTAFLLLPIPQLEGWRRYLTAGILLILALTGPTGLVLLPFYVLRLGASGKKFPWIYVLAIGVGSLIQIPALHAWYAIDKDPSLSLDPKTLLLCLKIAVVRIPWSLAVGYQPYDPYWLIGLFFVAVLMAFMAWEIKSGLLKHSFALGCLVLCTVFFCAAIFRIYPPEDVVPLVNGDRYFYTPKILFVWALIQFVSNARNAMPYYIALGLCVLGSLVDFKSSENIVDNDWPRYAVLIDEGNTVVLPVNPQGWTALVKGRNPAPVP